MNKYKYPNEIYSVESDGEIQIWELYETYIINRPFVYYKINNSNFIIVLERILSEEKFKRQININSCYLTIEEALNHEGIL